MAILFLSLIVLTHWFGINIYKFLAALHTILVLIQSWGNIISGCGKWQFSLTTCKKYLKRYNYFLLIQPKWLGQKKVVLIKFLSKKQLLRFKFFSIGILRKLVCIISPTFVIYELLLYKVSLKYLTFVGLTKEWEECLAILVTWEGVNNNKTECGETTKGRTIKLACSIYPKPATWG